MTETLPLLASATGDTGENVQVSPEGKPLHAKLTLPANPFTEVTVTEKLPEPPALDTVTAGFDEDMEKVGPQDFVRFVTLRDPRPVARL